MVGDLDLYLPDAEPSVLPDASTWSSELVITEVRVNQVSAYQFDVYIDVDGEYEVGYVYLDFGVDGVYRVVPSALPADAPVTVCGVAANQLGVTCTSACLMACSCLQCSDSDVELNAEQSCALNCTLLDDNGGLADEPYYGSEQAYAEVLYEGLDEYGIVGLAEQLGCGASACVDAANTTTRTTYSIRFVLPELSRETLNFAPQVVANDAPIASSPFGRGMISSCSMDGVVRSCP